MSGESAGWIGFGMAVVTMIGGLIKAAIDTWSKGKETTTAVKLALLEEHVKSCNDGHDATKRALEKCEKGHVANDVRLSALESLVMPAKVEAKIELKESRK